MTNPSNSGSKKMELIVPSLVIGIWSLVIRGSVARYSSTTNWMSFATWPSA
jgi:hypothetical protein